MNCCTDSYATFNKTFNSKLAFKDLKKFRKKGPSKSTKKLIDSIINYQQGDVKNKSLLDIGAGIGAIGLTLNENETLHVTSVDVSMEYQKKAEEEVSIRGLKNQFEFINGDFLQTSERLPIADIVTLDKAICCYRDFQDLVRASVKKSKRIYGIVIPRDTWWVKSVNGLGNFIRLITRDTFRSYVHPVDQIIDIIRENGFRNTYSETAREWLILLFVPENPRDQKQP